MRLGEPEGAVATNTDDDDARALRAGHALAALVGGTVPESQVASVSQFGLHLTSRAIDSAFLWNEFRMRGALDLTSPRNESVVCIGILCSTRVRVDLTLGVIRALCTPACSARRA